jgi:uncharacterized protein
MNDARIHTIDAVRGVAVMGILLMNIVAFAMPGYAYVDPTYYGWHGDADRIVWTANYVLSDGKFRALFTMLFGASMVLIAERAAGNGEGISPVATHYRRMFWLFWFGMIHAWLLWYGDILVQYAIGGIIGFLMWRWPPRALWVVFITMMALQTASSIGHYRALVPTRAAAMAPDATPQAIYRWQLRKAEEAPTVADAAKEVAGYRGGLKSVFDTRAPSTMLFQTVIVPNSMPEIFAFMAFGILFLRNGFLTGGWLARRYVLVIAIGYLVAAPLTWQIARLLLASKFDPAIMALADIFSLLLRPFIAAAHAAVVILAMRSDHLRWLSSRLVAAGRTAFSNYIATTLIATTLFYGYGFNLFGTFSRAQLFPIVVAIWLAILLWSKPWLDRFRYGPLEWLWRSLARWAWQPTRRQIRPNP